MGVLLITLAMVAGSRAEGAASAGTRKPAPARTYAGTRLSGPAPVIDGRLDDACWQDQGEWAGDFTQREPHEGAKPTLPTELKSPLRQPQYVRRHPGL
jgi:hypothetical protein